MNSDLPPFWSLVETYGDELLRHARRLAVTDPEDVLQEAFLRALRSYPRLSHADHLRAWLFRITTTTALDQSAARSRRRSVERKAAAPEITDPEALDGFEDLIVHLPEGVQSALRLRFVEDLPYDAIAGRLGCSESAARKRVSSAITKMRGRLT